MSDVTTDATDRTVLLLLCFLFVLILALIFLYKKLNRDADGQYTVRRMVYKEGGVRDRVRGAAMGLQSCLGIHLWPRNDEEEDGEEMHEVRGGGRDVERASRGGESEAGAEDDRDEREGEDEDSSTSDDYSSLDGCDLRELAKLRGQREVMGRAEGGSTEKGEEKEEEENRESGGGASGGTGLLIDLKQFSGSAIWSEEKTTDNKDSDLTAF